jgi:hypothetical protein
MEGSMPDTNAANQKQPARKPDDDLSKSPERAQVELSDEELKKAAGGQPSASEITIKKTTDTTTGPLP